MFTLSFDGALKIAECGLSHGSDKFSYEPKHEVAKSMSGATTAIVNVLAIGLKDASV